METYKISKTQLKQSEDRIRELTSENKRLTKNYLDLCKTLGEVKQNAKTYETYSMMWFGITVILLIALIYK